MINRGFAAIALVNPKDRNNVGSVLRAAGCYGASLVVIAGSRPERYMGKIVTDTEKAYRHIPVLRCEDEFDCIPYDCVPVAVEFLPHGISLVDFTHPERAYYIFGPEDGTLGRRVTDRCKFVVQIPSFYCLNLACATNVVLYDRMAKQLRRIEGNTRAA